MLEQLIEKRIESAMDRVKKGHALLAAGQTNPIETLADMSEQSWLADELRKILNQYRENRQIG